MAADTDISVVLPCYNAARVAGLTVRALADYLAGLARTWELIVVDDGSTDGTCAAVDDAGRALAQPRIRVLRHERNLGKGRAVRDGMLAARGRYRIFVDADLDYPPSEIGKILARLEAGADVAVASRVAAGATMTLSPWHIQYIYTRHLMSRILNKVFRNLFVRGITDSQAGLKGFTAPAAEAVFARTTVDGFSFDIEALYIARHLGLTIEETPVHYFYGHQPSTVAFMKDGMNLIRDMLRTKWNAARGVYDAAPAEGRPPLPRHLVVTADDFGLSAWANRGIVRGVNSGAVSSVSVMASPHLERWPGPRRPTVGFGLHVNLTEGKPAGEPGPLAPILRPDGRFAGLVPLARQVLRGGVSASCLTRELLAQARRVERAGFRLDHIDGHEHVQHLPVVRRAVAKTARRLGISWVRVSSERVAYGLTAWTCTARKLAMLPFAASARCLFHSLGLRSPDRFFGLALVRPPDFARALAAAVAESRGRVNEIALHLAEPGGEADDRIGDWRSAGLTALLDWDARAAARKAGLTLTSFAAIRPNADRRSDGP